jgi:hypothetical protein
LLLDVALTHIGHAPAASHPELVAGEVLAGTGTGDD